ncbi:hypothetical protein CAI21_11145 [Alkalilimnicola ehrlichii]|uniref:Uncharacterized protein n=1 Tax=Alkalilimnicola ehrlichii TaxID=351052 RepID=A0A3E0X0C4_9GAMM|nr:ribonucleotide reductase subunit alpha [Alkalilimnicola ehrlichii]RFA28999.1 hypothetical protein CAI21_11145 [Alkalilimnicola ehrlichii]RFA38635.1 hypothetical protein CAL65_04695 [Alkalilimnicola ehrlichii]
MEIEGFEDLLKVARQQPEPQRLLFVFAKPVLPKDPDPEEVRRFEAGRGGALQPLMSVDKRPEDLSSFQALCKEADSRNPEWKMVFVAALAGAGDKPPSSETVDASLEVMINTIQSGGDISRYLAFDRGGDLLAISLR